MTFAERRPFLIVLPVDALSNDIGFYLHLYDIMKTVI